MEKEAESSKDTVTRTKRAIKRPARYDDEAPEEKKLATTQTKKGIEKKNPKSKAQPSEKNNAKKHLANAMKLSGQKILQLKNDLDKRIKDNPMLEAARRTAASELSTSEESDEEGVS